MKDRSRPRWKLVSWVALLAGGAASACSVDARSPQDGEEVADETAGSVGLQLRLGDVTLNSVDYVITGSGFVKNGAIDVSKSRTISATIGGIPAGTGYSLTLSATDATDSRIV